MKAILAALISLALVAPLAGCSGYAEKCGPIAKTLGCRETP